MLNQSFGVYIHIPYCRSICSYCGFVRRPLAGVVPGAFVDALCVEIERFEGPSEAATIFFGGGTPSLLSGPVLETVFKALHGRFALTDPEVTVEANPDDITVDLIAALRNCGVNRVSLGIQSFDNATLNYLGRRHDAATALKAIDLVASSFGNWSIDLIYGTLPADSWGRTLDTATRLNPPHISTYALTYVPETPLYDRFQRMRLEDDEVLGLYQQTEDALTGYVHYEISNFARDGYQCRHNLLYWHNEQHAGFGPGAYSLIGNRRLANPADPDVYIARPGIPEDIVLLSRREQQVETLIQHFRLRDGIEEAYYKNRFGEDIAAGFEATLSLLIARGLLLRKNGRIVPTPQGFYLNDEIGISLVGA